jgi:cytidylate kinase
MCHLLSYYFVIQPFTNIMRALLNNIMERIMKNIQRFYSIFCNNFDFDKYNINKLIINSKKETDRANTHLTSPPLTS